jgi:hypothetical protein
MQKVQYYFFLVLSMVLLSSTLTAQVPERVLFVGNSYTYFWNLPQQVAAMAESKQMVIHTQQSTSGGTSLAQHWRGEKKLHSLEMIRAGEYDAVVLQDFSTQALDAPDTLLYFGQQFAQEIKAKGGKVYLYMTWARSWDPYMQAAITARYEELAQLCDATIVPVGPAWQRASSLRPDIELYDKDQSHPSPLGSYLSACVFYGVFTCQSPVGLSNRLLSTDHAGEKIYLNIQSKEDALFCQKVAADILGLPLDATHK